MSKEKKQTTTPVPEAKPERLFSWRAAAVIITALGALAYINSFEGSFVYDDLLFVAVPDVRHLWPPWQAMFDQQFISRPLIGLSLAINYAISGVHPWSYHLFNLLAHIAAALALFGIVRRTLTTDLLRERFGKNALALSLIVALVWMVHPLQTQAVTYIIQRCESLMGMFYLVTLYCAIRSFDAEKKRVWYAAAVAACAGGMMSKQVMVTAPLVVLLYDAMFSSGSLKEAIKKRWGLYAGLSATWIILAATTIASPVNETAGFAVKGISPLRYFVSQFEVIVHYLRLSFWPDSLVLDYRWPVTESVARALPYGAILILLAGATLWGVIKRRAWGFAGAWFFVILSVTSSFMPYSDLAFEHRMYLPLAGVVAIVVLGGYAAGKRWLGSLKMGEEQRQKTSRSLSFAVVAIALTVLVLLTLRRNVDYRSQFVIWTDTVSKRPENDRARTNLGKCFEQMGLLDEALVHYQAACDYNPKDAVAHNNLGSLLSKFGRAEESKAHLEESVRLRPDYTLAHYNLGLTFVSKGKYEEAILHFQQVLKYDPNDRDAAFYLAQSFEKLGKFREAIDSYKLTVQLNPNWPPALACLSRILASQDDSQFRNTGESVRLAERAVSLTQRRDLFALETLAIAYAESQQFSDAVRVSQETIGLASQQKEKAIAANMEERLKLYKAGRSRPEPSNALASQ